MKIKTIDVEDNDWLECYHINITCPYCGEMQEYVTFDWFDETEKPRCTKCRKLFLIKTNNFVGVI